MVSGQDESTYQNKTCITLVCIGMMVSVQDGGVAESHLPDGVMMIEVYTITPSFIQCHAGGLFSRMLCDLDISLVRAFRFEVYLRITHHRMQVEVASRTTPCRR